MTIHDVASSRDLALLIGSRYYIGSPCEFRHSGRRYAGNKQCVECAAIKGAQYKASRADIEKARKQAWKQAHRAEVLAEKRAYYQRHKADVLARDRAYVVADPYGTIAARRERARLAALERAKARAEWRERRRPALKEKARIAAIMLRMMRTPEEVEAERASRRASYRRQMMRNPEGMRDAWRAKTAFRRAIRKGAKGRTSAEAIRLLRILQFGGCAYCGRTGNLHLDHVRPLARGGTHLPDNLQWLCADHNMSKSALLDHEYRDRNGIPRLTRWDWRRNAALFFAF